jgi:hypothetical protein
MGVVLLCSLRNSAESAPWLTHQERDALAALLQAERTTKIQHAHVRQFLGDWHIWSLSGIYFCTVIGLAALGFWTPAIIKTVSTASVLLDGVLVAVPNIVTVGAVLASAAWADRTGKRRVAFCGAMMMGALGFLATLVAERSLALVVLGLSLPAVVLCQQWRCSGRCR